MSKPHGFKKGDRVAIYDGCKFYTRIVGVVGVNLSEDFLTVLTDDGRRLTPHHKQCRRLAKKQPPTRQIIWVEPSILKQPINTADGYVPAIRFKMSGETGDWVEFVARRK